MVGESRRTDLAVSADFSGPFRPNSTFTANTLLPSGTVAAACAPVRRTSGLRTIASAGRHAGHLVDRLGFPSRGRRHGRPMSTKSGSIPRAARARPRYPAGIRSIPSRHSLCGAVARARQGVGFPGVRYTCPAKTYALRHEKPARSRRVGCHGIGCRGPDTTQSAGPAKCSSEGLQRVAGTGTNAEPKSGPALPVRPDIGRRAVTRAQGPPPASRRTAWVRRPGGVARIFAPPSAPAGATSTGLDAEPTA